MVSEYQKEMKEVSFASPLSRFDLLCTQVAEWLWAAGGAGEQGAFPPEMSVPMTLMNTLRYGENSHQQAAVYSDGSLAELKGTGVAAATLHWGKEVSGKRGWVDTD